MKLMNCKIGAIKRIMDSLPAKNMREISKKGDFAECYVYVIMKEMRKANWLAYTKVGRSNKITLMPIGQKLKEALGQPT